MKKKYTPEIQEKIIGYVKAGNYVETVYRALGIDDTTFSDWWKKGESNIEPYSSFIDEIINSVSSCYEKNLQIVKKAARDGDKEAKACLNHEGKIVLTKDNKSYFQRFIDDRTGKSASEWRIAVFERDNYICQECGIRGGKLQSHHIKGWSDNPDLRFDINNGITLCLECHAKKHPGRENLIKKARYYKNEINT